MASVMKPFTTNKNRGFTKTELVVVIGLIIVVGFFFLPEVTPSRRIKASARIKCSNNLKNVGLAFRVFSTDHNDQYPMQLALAKGGSAEFVNNKASIWRHYLSLTNELSTPAILICPKDTRLVSTNFVTKIAIGSARSAIPFNSNSNISYFVGLDAREEVPSLLLAGDRNIQNTNPAVGSIKFNFPPSPPGQIVALGTNHSSKGNMGVSWTADLHQENGNVTLADGSVQQYTTSRLRDALKNSGDPTGGNRLAIPY
jgi:competence protein ComGC